MPQCAFMMFLQRQKNLLLLHWQQFQLLLPVTTAGSWDIIRSCHNFSESRPLNRKVKKVFKVPFFAHLFSMAILSNPNVLCAEIWDVIRLLSAS